MIEHNNLYNLIFNKVLYSLFIYIYYIDSPHFSKISPVVYHYAERSLLDDTPQHLSLQALKKTCIKWFS